MEREEIEKLAAELHRMAFFTHEERAKALYEAGYRLTLKPEPVVEVVKCTCGCGNSGHLHLPACAIIQAQNAEHHVAPHQMKAVDRSEEHTSELQSQSN